MQRKMSTETLLEEVKWVVLVITEWEQQEEPYAQANFGILSQPSFCLEY